MIEDSDYMHQWRVLANIRPNSKKIYESSLRKLDEYLISLGLHDGTSLDFDRFYVDSSTGHHYPIDRKFGIQYYEWLRQSGYSQLSKEAAVTAASNFFSVLFDNKLIRTNPFADVSFGHRAKPRRTRVLTTFEQRQLLEEAYKAQPDTLKYTAMILTLLHGGLRNSELRFLKWSDVSTEGQKLTLSEGTKGGAPRSVLISTALVKVLTRYKQSQAIEAHTWVFVNDKQEQLTSAELICIVKDLSAKAGINEPTVVTPHVLRHTWITELARGGISLPDIGPLAGHEFVYTTLSTYTHISRDDMRRALENSAINQVVETTLSRVLARLHDNSDRS